MRGIRAGNQRAAAFRSLHQPSVTVENRSFLAFARTIDACSGLIIRLPPVYHFQGERGRDGRMPVTSDPGLTNGTSACIA
jgi:hypothetical protein